jgi:outer membrane protein OmpA-like peptidoglycan-associated protein
MNEQTEYEEIVVGRDYSRIAYFLLATGIITGSIYLYKNFKPFTTEKRIVTETIKKEISVPHKDTVQKNFIPKQEIVVYFGYNQYILSESEKQKLQKLPDTIQDIVVHGYTDSDGNPEYNKKLSLKRIENAVQSMIQKYPNMQHIRITPAGEENLVIENSQENKAKSRRVEIKIQ